VWLPWVISIQEDPVAQRSMTVAPESFSGVQTSVSAVHLMLDGREIISLATIGPIVQEARRMFENGEWRKSSLNFDRAVVVFEQSTAQWRQKMNEAIAVARRQSTTPIAERKKGRGGSIGEIAKLNAEKTRVETQIAVAARLINRLKLGLQAETVAEESRVPQHDEEEAPSEGPSSVAQPDSSGDAGDRELAGRGLAKEAELQVAVDKGVARFLPSFPYGRLVLFAVSGEIVRVRRMRIRDAVRVQDPDNTMEEKTIPLRDFVERVQAGGVWLLRSSASSSPEADD
jgi:hypothetical protein